MTFSNLSRAVIEALIREDSDDRRFEEFCADLFSEIEGVQYETTSRGGDKGRDAKADFLPEGGVARICATTQRKGWKGKSESDIDKVSVNKLHVNRLRICTNQPKKETQLDQVLAYAQKKLPICESITAHALSGLTDLAVRRQHIVFRNYKHEIDEQSIWHRRHARDDDDDDQTLSLLRVALTTVFNPDILQMRESLMRTLVLTALSDSREVTIEALGARAAIAMKLSDTPEKSYWINSLQKLEGEGLVKRNGVYYRLTAVGLSYVDKLADQGTEKALSGRAAVRALFGADGMSVLSDDEFSSLWSAIQRRVEELFLLNGLHVIDEVRQLALGNTKPAATPLLTRLLDTLLSHLSTMHLVPSAEANAARILQDMFVQDESDAAKWMSELAAKYLVLASLGLDASLQCELQNRIACWRIVPDTHVVLSYLCEGDEGHQAAKLVLEQLQRLKAEIQAVDPVLEETLHHAVLAKKSFHEFFDRVTAAARLDGAVRPIDLIEPMDNAFVKGFAYAATYPMRKSDWSEYIEQFLGGDESDPSSLLATLKEDLGVTYEADVPDVIAAGDGYARQFLGDVPSGEGALSTLRCRWDGRLLAGTLVRGKNLPVEKRTMIISESSRIRRSLVRGVGAEQKKRLVVVALDALSFALASVPGTTVNLECVRHFLFGASEMIRLDHVSTRLLLSASLGTERLLRRHGLNRRLEDAVLDRRRP